jgi:hypothetical protein
VRRLVISWLVSTSWIAGFDYSSIVDTLSDWLENLKQWNWFIGSSFAYNKSSAPSTTPIDDYLIYRNMVNKFENEFETTDTSACNKLCGILELRWKDVFKTTLLRHPESRYSLHDTKLKLRSHIVKKVVVLFSSESHSNRVEIWIVTRTSIFSLQSNVRTYV